MIIACVDEDGSFDLPHRHISTRKTNELSTERERNTERAFFYRQTRERERRKTANETRKGEECHHHPLLSLSHTTHLFPSPLSLSANRTIVVVGDILLGSRAQYTHTHISSSVWIKCVFTYFDRDI